MNNLPENLEDLVQLRKEYKRLLREFNRLKIENKRLKERVGLGDFKSSPNSTLGLKLEKNSPDAETIDGIPDSIISNTSDSPEKIMLFMTLLK
jgi:regulator of replication initiation timing